MPDPNKTMVSFTYSQLFADDEHAIEIIEAIINDSDLVKYRTFDKGSIKIEHIVDRTKEKSNGRSD